MPPFCLHCTMARKAPKRKVARGRRSPETPSFLQKACHALLLPPKTGPFREALLVGRATFRRGARTFRQSGSIRRKGRNASCAERRPPLPLITPTKLSPRTVLCQKNGHAIAKTFLRPPLNSPHRPARHDLVISSRSSVQKNGAPRLGTRLSSMSAGRGAPGKTGDRSVVAFFLSDGPCKGERPFCSSPRPARSRTARQGRVPEKARGSGPGLPETFMREPRGVRPAASPHPSPAGNSGASLASCSPGACFRPFVFDGSLPLVHAHGGRGRAGACPARRRGRPAPPFPSRRARDGLRTPAPRSTPPFRDCRRRRRPTPPSSA